MKEIATIDALSGGRYTMGIEHSGEAWDAVMRYAREECLEERVLEAARIAIWVHRLLWDGPFEAPGLLSAYPRT